MDCRLHAKSFNCVRIPHSDQNPYKYYPAFCKATGIEMEPSTASDPSAFLSEIIGVPVTVKLNSGVVYKGKKPPMVFLALTFLILQASSNLWMDI
jgi:hypothetical protein